MLRVIEQTSLPLLLPTIKFFLLKLEENLRGRALPDLDKVLAGAGRLKAGTCAWPGLTVHHFDGQFFQGDPACEKLAVASRACVSWLPMGRPSYSWKMTVCWTERL